MAESDREQDEITEVNPRLVMGVVGMSATFANFLSSLLSAPSWQPVAGLGAASYSQTVCFLLACVCTYVLLAIFAGRIVKFRTGAYLVAVVAFLASGVLSLILERFLMAAIALVAVSTTTMATLFIDSLCGRKTNARKSLSSAFSLAALFNLFIFFISVQYLEAVRLVLGLLPLLIYPFSLSREELNEEWGQPGSVALLRKVIPWQSHVLTFLAATVMGFSLYWPLHTGYSFESDALLRSGIALVAALLCADSFIGVFVEARVLRTLRMPFTVLFLLPLLFVPKEHWTSCCFGALLISFISYFSSMFAISEICVNNKLSPFRVFSAARSLYLLGLLLGLSLGWLSKREGMLEGYGHQVCVTVLIFLFIAVFTLLNAKNYYPGRETEGMVVDEKALLKSEEEVLERVLTAKCQRFARVHDLTRRQQEVLGLLARGHSSESISNKLVISPHTVKAHVYSIYQKSGAHSRQELVELISQMSLSDELPKNGKEPEER